MKEFLSNWAIGTLGFLVVLGIFILPFVAVYGLIALGSSHPNIAVGLGIILSCALLGLTFAISEAAK